MMKPAWTLALHFRGIRFRVAPQAFFPWQFCCFKVVSNLLHRLLEHLAYSNIFSLAVHMPYTNVYNLAGPYGSNIFELAVHIQHTSAHSFL